MTDFSDETKVQQEYADQLKMATMWAEHIKIFVNACSMEWRVVESVHSPAKDVAELDRMYGKLREAFAAMAKVAPNTRHPENALQRAQPPREESGPELCEECWDHICSECQDNLAGSSA